MLKAFSALMIAATVGGYFALSNLTYQFQDLLPKDSKFKQSEAATIARYPISEQLIIRISGADPDAHELFTQQLGELLSLSEKTEYEFSSAKKFIEEHLAFYIDPELLEPILKIEQEQTSPFTILKKSAAWLKLTTASSSINRYAQMTRGYFASSDRMQYLVFVYPQMQHASYSQAKAVIALVEASIAKIKDTNPRFSKIKTDLVGSVVLITQEHESVFNDLIRSTLIVFSLLFLVLFLYFNSLTSVLLSLFPALCGVILTVTVSSPLLFPLSANSVFFLSVIFGNGMNAAIIFLSRAAELKNSVKDWITQAKEETRRPTFVASFAATCAYGALALSSFKGFFQLGILGIIGMLFCWAVTYFVLPSVLSIELISRRFTAKSYRQSTLEKTSKKKLLYLGITLASVASIISILFMMRKDFQVFELNVDNLRSKKSIETIKTYQEVARIMGAVTNPIIVLAHDVGSACQIANQVMSSPPGAVRKPFIKSAFCIDSFVPLEQNERIAKFKKLIQRYPTTPSDPRLQQLLQKIKASLKAKTFTRDDLPKIILNKFSEKDGTVGKVILIELNPGKTLWEKGFLFPVIGEITQVVESESKGSIYLSSHFLATELFEMMRREGTKVIFVSLLSVILGIFALLRKEKSIWFVVSSLTLGLFWYIGLWVGFGLKIHFISFMAIPITFGVGVDYAINLHYRKSDARVGAVVLCSLTTIIGWGAFALASSQALASFGFAAVLGEFACLFAALSLFWLSRASKNKHDPINRRKI